MRWSHWRHLTLAALSAPVVVGRPFLDVASFGLPATETTVDVEASVEPDSDAAAPSLTDYDGLEVSGKWMEADGGPGRYILEHFEDPSFPVTRANTTFVLRCLSACWWRVGFCRLAEEIGTKSLTCDLDIGMVLTGYLRRRFDRNLVALEFQDSAEDGLREVWIRSTDKSHSSSEETVTGRVDLKPSVRKVHIVFASLTNCDGYQSVNEEFALQMKALAKLAELSEKVDAQGAGSTGLFYTLQPWLLQYYLHCPCADSPSACPARVLNAPNVSAALPCPSQRELYLLQAAVQRGHLLWSAGPGSAEVGSGLELFQVGLSISRGLDRRFFPGRRHSKTMVVCNSAYPSRSVLPVLKKAGITGIVVGASEGDAVKRNTGGPLPKVPKLHLWVDGNSDSDAIVAYFPYPISGKSIPDCAESEAGGLVLCARFTAPTSIEEVQQAVEETKAAYPDAEVVVSTFDGFMDEVKPWTNLLPVVTKEVGSASTCEVVANPIAEAESRALQRVWNGCNESVGRRCAADDPAIANMTFFMLRGKSASHSAAERRFFDELAVRALEEAGHPLGAVAREEISRVLHPEHPNLTMYRRLSNLSDLIELDDGQRKTLVQFGSSGAIVKLRSGDVEWATVESPMGSFIYETIDEKNQLSTWKPFVSELWIDNSSASVIAVLKMPSKSQSKIFGAPREVHLNVTLNKANGSSSVKGIRNSSAMLNLVVSIIGKRPSNQSEASMLLFRPAPHLNVEASHTKIKPHYAWHRRAPHIRLPSTFAHRKHCNHFGCRAIDSTPTWRFLKLGEAVSPEDVASGGCSCCHEVWGGAVANTVSGLFYLNSVDSGAFRTVTSSGRPCGTSPLSCDGHCSGEVETDDVIGLAVQLQQNNLRQDRKTQIDDEQLPELMQFRFQLSLGGLEDDNADVNGQVHPARRPNTPAETAGLVAIVFLGGVVLMFGLRALSGEDDELWGDASNEDSSARAAETQRRLEQLMQRQQQTGVGARAVLAAAGRANNMYVLRVGERYLQLGRMG
eukprot:TRINITY_DN27660_c0_g1_i1.p1 TRINITY_DN27660_c0_g1~~TRINITY_DN27660_c0_g1_i1.p1  ORF type:complete len:1016 (+),score=174.09 TRINITY_DN27660_c0_g1_i1:85-3132(+)